MAGVTNFCTNHPGMSDQQVVLVVGSCGLDRLLCVPKYPAADAKIRTTSYHESGGGNAANTAATIGRLANATFASNHNVQVKYLGKVGQDQKGKQLLKELNDSNVDTSSPLCLQGAPGSTTSFTTIIVDEQDHTRTCFHTPGSCGELTVEDCQNVDMDVVFQNVIHLHSDARHTSAALYLAEQAHQRGITVSCDCEKDRNHEDLDKLLQISDVLFTNSGCLGEYLARLTSKYEQDQSVTALHLPPVIETSLGFDEKTLDTIIRSLSPSAFLARWHPQLGREVIVTHGNLGSLHYRLNGLCSQGMIGCTSEVEATNNIAITTAQETGNSFFLKHRYVTTTASRDSVKESSSLQEYDYNIVPTGILSNAKVVDTTGAGDAFMGGYLLVMVVCRQHSPNVQLATNFGSWVAGRKVQAPGVRDSLPTGLDVDTHLGTTTTAIEKELNNIISSFNTGA